MDYGDAMTDQEIVASQLAQALRALDRFDNADRGSRWITNPEEGAKLIQRVKKLDAELERLSEPCVGCWSLGPDFSEACPGPNHG